MKNIALPFTRRAATLLGAVLILAACSPAPTPQPAPTTVLNMPLVNNAQATQLAATQALALPLVNSASATQAAVDETQPAATADISDPFAYCTSAGDVDNPGVKAPEAVLKGIQKAAGISADIPADVLQNGTTWRCMNGKVYACFVGANLPCESRANTSRVPTDAEIEYCKANPTSDVIPAVATGHDTVFEWHCVLGAPQVAKQVYQVDPRGYIAEIWYAIGAQ
jgi:hypothetical protein